MMIIPNINGNKNGNQTTNQSSIRWVHDVKTINQPDIGSDFPIWTIPPFQGPIFGQRPWSSMVSRRWMRLRRTRRGWRMTHFVGRSALASPMVFFRKHMGIFHHVGYVGYLIAGWFTYGKIPLKWNDFGGTPMLGNLHIVSDFGGIRAVLKLFCRFFLSKKETYWSRPYCTDLGLVFGLLDHRFQYEAMVYWSFMTWGWLGVPWKNGNLHTSINLRWTKGGTIRKQPVFRLKTTCQKRRGEVSGVFPKNLKSQVCLKIGYS